MRNEPVNWRPVVWANFNRVQTKCPRAGAAFCAPYASFSVLGPKYFSSRRTEKDGGERS